MTEAPARASLVEVLAEHARADPDAVALRFLPPGHAPGDRGTAVTRAELDRRARSVAVSLRDEGLAGERVLMPLGPGPDFVAGVLGCLYAGAAAVPCAPDAGPAASLAADAEVAAVLTTGGPASDLRSGWGPDRWVAVDAPDDGRARRWEPPAVSADDTALLQYTSGSTGRPKAVVVSVGNLAAQIDNFRALTGLPAGGNVVCWMSTLHALGLGHVLLAGLVGGEAVLMTPEDFVADPLRWLAAVSATPGPVFSGGPNFAYERCTRSVTAEQRAGLDLSGWQVALIGGERVQRPTLDRFAEAFGPAGFRRSALFPAYGLTETMQIVVGNRSGRISVEVDAAELEQGRAVPAGVDRAQELARCGVAGPNGHVVVVDTASGAVCDDGRVGEVWVRGPVVCHGYRNRPDETAATFGGFLADGDGPYVRTGDLAFVDDGDLVLCGRLKEVIIINGRNLYPQDVEQTAGRVDPALADLPVAAFSVDSADGERLVVVAAVDPASADDGVAERIRVAVTGEHRVDVHEAVLVAPAAIPRTASGKVRRRGCRDAWADGSLVALATSTRPDSATAETTTGLDAAALRATAPGDRVATLVADLSNRVGAALGVEPSTLPADRSLVALGLESTRLIRLRHDLERDFAVTVPTSEFLRASVDDLCRLVLAGIG